MVLVGFGDFMFYGSKLKQNVASYLREVRELRLASVPPLVSACYAKKSNSRQEASLKRQSCSEASKRDVYPDMGRIPVR